MFELKCVTFDPCVNRQIEHIKQVLQQMFHKYCKHFYRTIIYQKLAKK